MKSKLGFGRAKEDEKKLSDTKNEAKSNLFILKKLNNEIKTKRCIPYLLSYEAKANRSFLKC